MKIMKIFGAGVLCTVMALASACSSKSADNASAEAADTTAAATEAPVAAAGVIELAKGEALDLSQGKPVIVDFNATWCGPCKQFAPTFHAVAEKFAGKVLFYSVDVDVHPELAAQYGVTGIPHIQFINPADSTANTSLMGVQTAEDFTKAVEAFVK